MPAPDFQLRDQFGETLSLSGLGGKVVVLTFLYTYCPDVCPVTTETLRQAHQLLGDAAAGVEIVAVTVDPERDTVDRVHEYSEQKGMLDRWRFLVGQREQVTAVWRDYWLDPLQKGGAGVLDHDTGQPAQDGGDLRGTTDSVESYLVDHTAPVFLIDAAGFRRVVFTSLSLDPEPLVHDIRLLLR